MNAQEIREKANALGITIRDLVARFENETDTTLIDLALVRADEWLAIGQSRQDLACIQVGVKVL